MNPEIYFIARDGVVHVFDAYGIAFGTVIWNAETQARFTPEEAVLRAAELNFEAGWSGPCVVNGVELDVAGVVPPAETWVLVASNAATPETDAAEDALENAAEYRARHVSAKFARRLERERDHYREARDELKHELAVARAASKSWHKLYVESRDYPANQHADCCELLGISADPSSDGPTLLEAVASLQQERDDAEASARALCGEVGTLIGLLKEWQQFAHIGVGVSELRKMTDAVLTAVEGGVA